MNRKNTKNKSKKKLKPVTEQQIKSFITPYVDEFTPIFNEDGECVANSEWDYPGSPYLNEEDNIY